MVLEGSNLFGRASDIPIREEESKVLPVISPREIVYWNQVAGAGEFYAAALNSNHVLSATTTRNSQSFTTGTAAINAVFKCSSIEVNASARAQTTGVFKIELFAADGNRKPTGPVLASGTLATTNMVLNPGVSISADNLANVPMNTPYDLQPDTTYVIVMQVSDASDTVDIFNDNGDEGLAPEKSWLSVDSGANYNIDNGDSFRFKIRGDGEFFLVNMKGTVKQIKLEDF